MWHFPNKNTAHLATTPPFPLDRFAFEYTSSYQDWIFFPTSFPGGLKNYILIYFSPIDNREKLEIENTNTMK